MEVLITVIISITSIFFWLQSERDDISNACTGNRILTSLKIMGYNNEKEASEEEIRVYGVFAGAYQ